MTRQQYARTVGVWGRLVSCAAALVCSQPAAAQTALRVAGDLVIAGGGSNTTVLRYSSGAVGDPTGTSGPLTIQLSAEHPTLVIRGPQHYAEACGSVADCWDSDVCAGAGPGKYGACGWSGTALPAACAPPVSLNAGLDACAETLAGARHDAGYASVGAGTDACISTATTIARLEGACPAQSYRDAYDTAIFELMTRSQAQMRASGGRLVQTDVRSHLKRLGDWYAAYRSLYPASQGDAANDRVWSQTSRVLGSFWKGAYAAVGLPQPGATNPSDAVLDHLFRDGVEADRTVLAAALTSPVPIRTAPLVQLMGDALHSMSSRLTEVGRYHDLGCRFRDNAAAGRIPCGGDQVTTEIAELVRLLAAAAHPTELEQALLRPAPSTVTTHWEGWRSVFSALSVQQSGSSAPFQEAVLDALPGITAYSPDLIAPPPPTTGNPVAPPRTTPPLMGLARIVQEARVRANSYQQTGLFDSRYQGVLRAGMQEARVNEVINRTANRTVDLEGEVTNYRSTRLQLANAILQGMTNLATQQRVTDEIVQRKVKEDQLRADLAGIRNTIEVQEARYSDFMKAYATLSRIVADKPGTEINHATGRITVRPADARWVPAANGTSAWDLLTDIVSTPSGTINSQPLTWPIQAKKGDILNLATSGTWSPSCALRTYAFTNPLNGQPDKFMVPAPALTGPEGYLLTLSGSRFSATANQSVHSEESYVNEGRSTKYCGGIGASVGLGLSEKALPLTAGVSASASAEWCKYRDVGKKTSDLTSESQSTGSESRMAAAFATGIRVPTTPFPTFPAGALLVVQVARDGTTRGEIREVQVLQNPSTSIVLADDADVFLVVNDVVDGACGPPDASALTVSLDRIRPYGQVAIDLGNGMANALGRLRVQQGQYIEQGRVGAQQMAELRDEAFDELVTACGSRCTQIGYYPPEVLRFFESWVSKELATIERKVDARTLERELALIELELAALAHDFRNLGEQARLLRLLPTWLLKDLSAEVLQAKAQSLVDLLVADLYPIIDLRQPATLANLDGRMLEALLGMNVMLDPAPLDWTGDLTDWSSAAARASENIVARLQDSLGNSPPLNDRILALGIPNPEAPRPLQGRWQRVSAERAKVVWDAIAAREPFVQLAIEPTDLYAMYPWSTNAMLCNESEPVVTAMAVYMVRPFPEGPTFPGLYVPVSVDRNQMFPGAGLLKSYRIDNDDWLSQGVRVTAGEAQYLEEDVAALMSDNATPLYRVANGLSPFTKFDISLGGIATAPSYPAPANDATELVVVFRVETRNVANVHLSPMCP